MNVRFDIRVVLMKIQVLWGDWYMLTTFGRMYCCHYQIQVFQEYGLNLTSITWLIFSALNQIRVLKSFKLREISMKARKMFIF